MRAHPVSFLGTTDVKEARKSEAEAVARYYEAEVEAEKNYEAEAKLCETEAGPETLYKFRNTAYEHVHSNT